MAQVPCRMMMSHSMMRIPLRYLVLHTDRPLQETGTNLRGYIGNKFREYPLLHHHLDRPILAYPKVQYKVIGELLPSWVSLTGHR